MPLRRRRIVRRVKRVRGKRPTPRVKSYVKRVLSKAQEHKYSDLELTVSTASTTATLWFLNGITQGTNQSNRVGNEVRFIKLELVYQFALVSAGDFTNICRIIVVRDRQPNAAAFAITDLLQSGSNPLSPMYEDNRKRFHIHYDRLVDLSLNGPAAKHSKRTVKLNFQTEYKGTGALISNIMTNSLYLVVMSDSGAVTHPQYTAYLRLWYVDS